ncbi:ABC transporter substrate-binding protein [Streptosporangium sp. NPDC051022]|uniref:ABC transporter substrate-binding protein n=1 Tax=Streptosporangium sp. NPDC051022 TaxID=3155752 RepID=UPI00344AE31A
MRLRSTLIAVAGIVALAVGCGGQGAPATTGKGAVDSTADSTATSAKPERADLKVAVPSKIDSIDPLIASGVTEIQVLRLVAGTLFTLDYDGKGVTPGLAKSGEFAADGRSYKATLKEGLTFSDGSPLTSADVVATFERARAFESNVYAGEYAPVRKATAVDPATVEFAFTRAFPSFETMISFPEFSILKKSEIGAKGAIPPSPTLAGPYVVEGDVHGNSYALTRNTAYSGPEPSVKKISFSVVPDASGRLTQVRGGQADLAVDIGVQAISQSLSGVSVHANPSMIITQLTFSANTAPLTDVNVRKAISAALDRKKISQIAWAGAMPPNAGLLPTGSIGAAPGNAGADPAAAKELLKGTACENGCSLSLLLDGSSGWQSSSATIIEQNLKEIGITVSIQPLETITLYDRLGKGDFQLATGYFGAYADLPDATPQYCLSHSYGFLSCYTGYKSAEAETAVGKAVTATDEAALKDAYAGVNAIFEKDAPLATLTDYAAVWAVRDDARGYASIGATAFITIAPKG